MMASESDEPMKFPIVFDACPNPTCGSAERIAEEYMKQLKEEGYLSPEYPPGLLHQIPVVDPTKLQKSALSSLTGKVKIKVVRVFWDVCAECGTMYCTSFDVTEQDAAIQQQPLPPPNRFIQPTPNRQERRHQN